MDPTLGIGGNPDRIVIMATIDDAEHFTDEERNRIIASYPLYERDARAKGIPTLGSGRIFPVSEDSIACDSIAIPAHWPQIGGMDFGYDHPFAAVCVAWDRDADVIYVTKVYRQRESTPVIHAASLKPWGANSSRHNEQWLPWSWPHDGLQHDKGSGEQLMRQYEAQGLNMLDERATFPDGGNGVEAGLMDMLDRMQTNRFKVFRHLTEWFEEFRLYHRKDGKVVKENDDCLAATRYALMMLRHAETAPDGAASRRPMLKGIV